MKISFPTILLLLSAVITSLGLPQLNSLLVRDDALAVPDPSELPDLEKRRGGGGRGGGGGGRSGGGGGGRSGSSGGRGGGSRGGSRGGGASSRTSPSSNTGGATRSGSGRQPSYGRGGAFYAGGASTPYAAGRRSPLGIAPFFLPLGALALFPGLWLYGAYAYPFHHQYHYVNQTTHRNESLPVVCLCQQYSECGCDGNNNQTYFESLFNGTEPKNSSVARVANVNGTEKIYINGTLPNGTTVADPSASSASVGVSLLQASGYWITAAVVAGAVWVL